MWSDKDGELLFMVTLDYEMFAWVSSEILLIIKHSLRKLSLDVSWYSKKKNGSIVQKFLSFEDIFEKASFSVY